MWRFTLFGFPVTVHWMFWVVMALLTWGMAGGNFLALALFVAAGFVSILLHELGHTFMQRHFGARAQIVLYGFGGLAIPDRNFTREQSIIVSLAGPVPQIILGLLVRELVRHGPNFGGPVTLFLIAFYIVSIFWGVINLLPIFPLDGGQVLRSFLGPQNEKKAYLVGAICAGGLALIMLAMPSWRSPWNIVLCGLLAWDNFQRYQGQTPPSFMRP